MNVLGIKEEEEMFLVTVSSVSNTLVENLGKSINQTDYIWVPIVVSLLSSSLLVGIIQFFQWNKNKEIDNITNERSKWREDMRQIVNKLRCFKFEWELNEALAKLKVRINPMGMFTEVDIEHLNRKERIDCFMRDYYIWHIIRLLESEEDISKLKSMADKLIEAISLLVKYDWNRSKGEVKLLENSKLWISFYTIFTLLLFFAFSTIIKFEVNLYQFFWLLLVFIVLPLAIQYGRRYVTHRLDLANMGIKDKGNKDKDNKDKDNKDKGKDRNRLIKWIISLIKYAHLRNLYTTFVIYLFLFGCFSGFTVFWLLESDGSTDIIILIINFLSVLLYLTFGKIIKTKLSFCEEYYFLIAEKIVAEAEKIAAVDVTQ